MAYVALKIYSCHGEEFTQSRSLIIILTKPHLSKDYI
jgi:hypothetical protein